MSDDLELRTEQDEDLEFELYRTDFMVCPWCGYEDRDSFEFDNDSATIDCNSCDKPFFYERIVDVSYSTRKPISA